jgi:hypothetical protein
MHDIKTNFIETLKLLYLYEKIYIQPQHFGQLLVYC